MSKKWITKWLWVTDSMWISLQWRALINSDLRAINRGCSEILWETEATYSGGGEAVSPRPSTWGRFARCFRTNSDRKSPVWGQGLGLGGGGGWLNRLRVCNESQYFDWFISFFVDLYLCFCCWGCHVTQQWFDWVTDELVLWLDKLLLAPCGYSRMIIMILDLSEGLKSFTGFILQSIQSVTQNEKWKEK